MSGRVQSCENANRLVDCALELLDGINAREAAARFGFGFTTISEWRRKRAQGVAILSVRGRNRAALERLLDGPASEPIPGVAVALRKRRI